MQNLWDQKVIINDVRYPVMSGFQWENLTPMLKQYYTVKSEYLDYILFYRLGDFYEMFMDDAIRAASLLEITLTTRGGVGEKKVALCGVPFHSVDQYLKKMIAQGESVAICEQTEDPSQTKGIVRREVVRIVTPGTVVEPELLDSSKSNYICAVLETADDMLDFAYCDISTGIVRTTKLKDQKELMTECLRLSPNEMIVSSDVEAYGLSIKKTIYHPESLLSMASAAEFLLHYIQYTAKNDQLRMQQQIHYSNDDYMQLDVGTIRNLELVETMRGKDKKGSLLGILDKTVTAMGARTLKAELLEPLLDRKEINARLDIVEVLHQDLIARSDLRHHLKKVYDLERLMTKLLYRTATPRDMIAIKNSLAVIPEIRSILQPIASMQDIFEELDDLKPLVQQLTQTMVEDAPVHTRELGFIKNGVNDELDQLRMRSKNGKQWILELEEKERVKTGIKPLKVGYNKVFGYYFEVSKSNKDRVPDYFIRKQTLVNAERFITEELKELEESVVTAKEKMLTLEQHIFQSVKEAVLVHLDVIRKDAAMLARIDKFAALAQVAFEQKYCRPTFDDQMKIEIVNGRHPVIEKGCEYIANDAMLNLEEKKVSIITGPNMAGKSSYLRQTALIALMAQIGSFVPATQARIGILDRIFTRVGASDDLAMGQSTFMVEMSELAYILTHRTSRSLIILDEIGRGTSTYDGLSIAWAVVEYLAAHQSITMFATHYHELTVLQGRLPGVVNYRVTAEEKAGNIVFLRKITVGGESKSYGIQVAKLAGVRQEVVDRATEILHSLETKKEQVSAPKKEAPVLIDPVRSDLYKLDVDELSPKQALALLYDWKSTYGQKGE